MKTIRTLKVIMLQKMIIILILIVTLQGYLVSGECNNFGYPVVTLCDDVDTYGKTLMIDASDTSMVNSSCTCRFSTTSPGAIRIYTETDEAYKRCGTYVEIRIEQPASLYTREISECTEHEIFLYSNSDIYEGHVTLHRNQQEMVSDFNQCVQLDYKGNGEIRLTCSRTTSDSAGHASCTKQLPTVTSLCGGGSVTGKEIQLSVGELDTTIEECSCTLTYSGTDGVPFSVEAPPYHSDCGTVVGLEYDDMKKNQYLRCSSGDMPDIVSGNTSVTMFVRVEKPWYFNPYFGYCFNIGRPDLQEDITITCSAPKALNATFTYPQSATSEATTKKTTAKPATAPTTKEPRIAPISGSQKIAAIIAGTVIAGVVLVILILAIACVVIRRTGAKNNQDEPPKRQRAKSMIFENTSRQNSLHKGPIK